MRALTRKAPVMLLALCVLAGSAQAGAWPDTPLWGFSPADSSSWSGDTLRISLRAGVAAVDSLYIVNESSDTVGPLTLGLLSDLYSDSGGSIPAASLSIDPSIVSELTAGASLQVLLGFNLSAETPPEIYRGVLQASDGGLEPFGEAVLELHVRGGERIRVAPNPVFTSRNAGVDFRFAASAGMHVTLEIYTLGMDRVRTLYDDGGWTDGSVATLSWDLRNEGGREVAAGMYLALARFEAGGERFNEIHRVMLVR